MQSLVLKSRAGFTLAEVLVALTMTAVIGAAVTGAFVSQSRFFDHQEKVGSARSVSRAAINVLMSELRMLEAPGGLQAATNSSITVNVPYAMGLYCGVVSGATKILRLPADSLMFETARYSGYAVRTSANSYSYAVGAAPPGDEEANATNCGTLTAAARAIPGVRVTSIPGGPNLGTPGVPVFLYQTIAYHFGPSIRVPGRTGLFRTTLSPTPKIEELLAPFDTTARFRFYVSDNAVAQTAVPGVLGTVTGIELTLDGLSERPNADGTFQNVPLRTSVFFRNR